MTRDIPALETSVSLLLEFSPREIAQENNKVPTEAVTRLFV
ncbi:hypothetical protein M7I_0206 [Glarea lozoyensis 74030]|uniref:Uncharacterized protein n=1 Tax=Glarea lozoyensis (strain ATCC 74030 / MF5533) TaxID=1104152 RepID=H0ECR1_GLAL7|nr:hypothetical protein M7I_0206 [Glarea lozoyensis 74030]